MITYETETISPAHAVKMLEGNTHNRNINDRHVHRLADSMRRGEWHLNGESIKLNGAIVLDGQHRLWACIESGRSFKTLVIRGLHQQTQKTVDTGIIRKNAHFFQMEGEQYTTLLAATISRIIGYKEKNQNVKSYGVTNVRAEKFLEEYPVLRELTHIYGASNQKILTRAVAAACHFIFSEIDEEKAEQFMASLIDGSGLEKGSPILTLRNKLINDLGAQRKIPVPIKFGLTIKTWNLWREGKVSRTIRFIPYGDRAEKFPVAE